MVTPDNKIECTCNVTARWIIYPNGAGRNLGVPPCMAPDCPAGFGNLVLAEQEEADDNYVDDSYGWPANK